MNSPDIQPPFAANAVRLSLRHWLAVGALSALLAAGLPATWARIEPLPECTNNRIPFRLGNDYWVFERYVRQAAQREQRLVLGDSVIWGHYVGKDGALTAHLNQLEGAERYANLGVDGIHPAALAGLVDCYGQAIRRCQVIVHCNLLWTSSRQHDLTSDKESTFNHPELVPQFRPEIPCYREPYATRLSYVVGRNVRLLAWSKHLQLAYLDGSDWAGWTLEHPYQCPLRQITFELPSPDEPPSPPPAREPWTEQGIRPANFRWVELETSLQWASFRRVVERLGRQQNRVFVVVGPFNEHLLTPASRTVYASRVAAVRQWLVDRRIPHHVAPLLPTETYGDASHPLDDGYRLMAESLAGDAEFQQFWGGL